MMRNLNNYNIVWNEDLINKTCDDFEDFCESEDIDSGITELATNKIATILEGYKNLGLHTSYALYDEVLEAYDTPLNLHIFERTTPFFKVLTDEFSGLLHYEKIYERDSGAKGANKSVAEDSPITTESVDSSEETDFEAEYPNPTTRAGNQYSNHAHSHDTVNDPKIEKEVLDYNIFGLNLTRICTKICRALTKEYIDIY